VLVFGGGERGGEDADKVEEELEVVRDLFNILNVDMMVVIIRVFYIIYLNN
jgi:hypothetical protein